MNTDQWASFTMPCVRTTAARRYYNMHHMYKFFLLTQNTVPIKLTCRIAPTTNDHWKYCGSGCRVVILFCKSVLSSRHHQSMEGGGLRSHVSMGMSSHISMLDVEANANLFCNRSFVPVTASVSTVKLITVLVAMPLQHPWRTRRPLSRRRSTRMRLRSSSFPRLLCRR